MPWLTPLADGWTGFFHGAQPATGLALFRVAFGGVLCANAILLAPDLAFLFGPDGAVADAHLSGAFGRRRFSLQRVLPSDGRWVGACLIVHGIAAVLLTVGLATRLSAITAFLTLLTLQSRNPLVTYGGDDVLRIMCFLLAFAPAGHTLSIDCRLTTGRWLAAAPVDGWCIRLMQLQVCVIYAKACVTKLRGRSWLDGRAPYYATEVEDFRRRRLPSWARRPAWCRAAAWGTLLVEGAFAPVTLATEWRTPMIAATVTLHATLEWFLNLYLFGAVMLACLLLFVNAAVIPSGWLPAIGIR